MAVQVQQMEEQMAEEDSEMLQQIEEEGGEMEGLLIAMDDQELRSGAGFLGV